MPAQKCETFLAKDMPAAGTGFGHNHSGFKNRRAAPIEICMMKTTRCCDLHVFETSAKVVSETMKRRALLGRLWKKPPLRAQQCSAFRFAEVSFFKFGPMPFASGDVAPGLLKISENHEVFDFLNCADGRQRAGHGSLDGAGPAGKRSR
jgi:hypothetical protein